MSNSWYFFSINSSRSVDCDRKKRFPVSVNTTVVNKYILLYNSILYSTRFYVVMWHQILFFLQNLVIPLQILLFANEEGSSSERRMEGGIADETSMPPLKCECFGSAA